MRAILDAPREHRSTARCSEQFFLDILRRGFTDEEARHQLDIAIDWGRYGELYDYDANTGLLSLELVKGAAEPV